MGDSSDEFATRLSSLRLIPIPPTEQYELPSGRKAKSHVQHADVKFDSSGEWVPFPAFDETRDDNDVFRFESPDMEQTRTTHSAKRSLERERVERKSKNNMIPGIYENPGRIKSPRPPKVPESRTPSLSRQSSVESRSSSHQGSVDAFQRKKTKKRSSNRKPQQSGDIRSRDSSAHRSRSESRSRSASRSRSNGKGVRRHTSCDEIHLQQTTNRSSSAKNATSNISLTQNSTSSLSTESRKSHLEIIIDTARANKDEKDMSIITTHNTNNSRKGRGIMEKLFGDTVDPSARSKYTSVTPRSKKTSCGGRALNLSEVQARALIPPAVYHNPTTDLWIATVNTNQQGLDGTNKENAPRYLKAFSFRTEQEARASAYANAPPRMIPFASSPECALCHGKFALFRRPRHCRNCGICVCSSCCTSWSSKMIPETYNVKNEKIVKACRSCDTLTKDFRKTLVEGNYTHAVELYLTGNISLRCPFVFSGEEMVFPIHCAVQGSSEKLLRWLVDVQFCPINLISTGNKAKTGKVAESPLLTSKGRSIMSIAMSTKNIGIMRYLVNEKGVSVHEEVTDLNLCLGALEAVIKGFRETPPASDSQPHSSSVKQPPSLHASGVKMGQVAQGDINSISVNYYAANQQDDNSAYGSDDKDCSFERADDESVESVTTTVPDACIICETKTIDCVITPCGHQICCLDCSTYLNACPICNGKCQFIKIFKP